MSADPDVLREMYKADMIRGEFYKWLLFLLYHTVVYGGIWLLTITFISPAFTTEWIIGLNWLSIGLNWLRNTIIVIAQVTLLGVFTHSILSCFSAKKLTKTQMGQWSLSEWMPTWGRNQKNSWYGLFLGLPDWLVKVQAIESVSTVITDKKEIQVEEAGNTDGRKFAAVFEFSFQYNVMDTLEHIRRPNSDKDLVNLVITYLTEWLNDSNHNYENILRLKAKKVEIQEWIIDQLLVSISMFGDEIINFRIIDIEVPQIQIDQQNRDAAALAAQKAVDERERLNIENQVKKMLDFGKNRKEIMAELSIDEAAFNNIFEQIERVEGRTRSNLNRNEGRGRPPLFGGGGPD